MRDAAARHEHRFTVILEDTQVDGLGEVETGGGRLDGGGGAERCLGRPGGAEVAHEAAGGEDDAAAPHADGRVASEDLEALEALVEVDVDDAASERSCTVLVATRSDTSALVTPRSAGFALT